MASRGHSTSTEKGREGQIVAFVERPSYARGSWLTILTGTLVNPGIRKGQRREAQISKDLIARPQPHGGSELEPWGLTQNRAHPGASAPRPTAPSIPCWGADEGGRYAGMSLPMRGQHKLLSGPQPSVSQLDCEQPASRDRALRLPLLPPTASNRVEPGAALSALL